MQEDLNKNFKGYMYLNYDIKIDNSNFKNHMKNLMKELERLYYKN